MTYEANENRYSSLTYNRCGRSGLKLPKVSLGLWHNFGDVDDYENSKKMSFRAFDLGITHFDLANNYGPPYGSAEKNFGKILKDGLGSYRDELVVSSKAGWDMWPGPYGNLGSKKYLIASLDQSLKRMGLEYVDIFYHHRPDPETPLEETMGALDQIVRSGKALYVGISQYSAVDSLRAFAILKSLGTPCLIHQPVYNMLNRWVEDGLLQVAEDSGVGVIAFSPLSQGLLTDKYIKGVPDGSRASKNNQGLSDKAQDQVFISKIKNLNELALSRGQTLAQMALTWVLRQKAVTSVLIGASRVGQIEDAVKVSSQAGLYPEEIQYIDNILLK